jgi:mono/diheme cytochrome c family protein
VSAEVLTRAEAEQSFTKSVWPLIVEKCHGCHGADPQDLQGDLDLSDPAGLFGLGRSGVQIVSPGDPEKGLLYKSINWRDGLEMPPKQNDRLTPEQIESVRQWIEAGAPWPKSSPAADDWTTGDAEGVRVPTSGGLSAEWNSRRYDPEALWAFRPLSRPTIPAAEGIEESPRSPIDAFINRGLRDSGIVPAGEADRRALIRRATLDLTGLPPTPEEIDAFLADDSHAAFECVIDRLLVSPHYGEQMSRRWLDVVRYADSDGYANDYERPNAWRYRDYVARAFNGDKPFDRFVREQIAGDELDSDDPECLIAVGFLRMGPWEHTIMAVAAETRQLLLDDIVNSVGNTFLGLEMSCCRCHDHKFDPLPTRDYYRLQAVFATLQPTDRKLPFLDSENSSSCDAGSKRHKQVLEHEDLRKSTVSSYTRWHSRAAKRYEPVAYSIYDGPSRIFDSNEVYQFPAAEEWAGGTAPPVSILLGGRLASPGEQVTTGALSAIAGLRGAPDSAAASSIPEDPRGRRLALANWIVSPENPLTPRVIVNRIWQQHFGELGLVRTPNQFGKMGSRPTNPELLDWLAQWFVDEGWSIKKLHRLIMQSQAYCRASASPQYEQIHQADPENRLLAHYPPRRLAAEEIRDAMLFVSGELNPEGGGPPVFPEMNWDTALQSRRTMVKDAAPYQPSATRAERNRRTLYAFRIRGLRDPFLEVFNQPDGATSCPKRDQTTITPQVFALFNSEFSHRRALAFAARLRQEGGDTDEQLRSAFRLALGRWPTSRELAAARSHLQAMTDYHQTHEPPETESALRDLVRRTSRYEPEYADAYQPDLQPADVDAATRGLAEFCLVLLNASEFLYVE